MENNLPHIANDSRGAPPIISATYVGAEPTVDESLVESIWKELHGQVDRTVIRQTLLEAYAAFRNATVTTYLPILFHRYVMESLQ